MSGPGNHGFGFALLVLGGLVSLGCADSEGLDVGPPGGGAGDTGPAAGGTTGTAGVNGSAGTFGAAGMAGNAGASGPGGTSGVAGTNGAAGRGGSTGRGGATGSAGRGGITGAAGRGGTTGSGGRGGTTGRGGVAGTSCLGGSTGAGGAAGATPTFTNVYNLVIVPNCSGAMCHNPGSQRGVSFANKTSAYSYATRNGQIDRNNPNNSYILFVMRGDPATCTPPFMPPSPNPKVAPDQLALMSFWIAAGYPNN